MAKFVSDIKLVLYDKGGMLLIMTCLGFAWFYGDTSRRKELEGWFVPIAVTYLSDRLKPAKDAKK